MKKIFVVENLAVFTTLGATTGLTLSAALTLASAGVQLKKNLENNINIKKFNKLDREKYYMEEQHESLLINEKKFNSPNFVENFIIDIMMCYFNERKINIGCTPKNIFELKTAIDKLKGNKKKEAHMVIAIIADSIDKKYSFAEMLNRFGTFSVYLFASGFAVLSIYDILNDGKILPELSQILFENNNVNTPIVVPESIETPFNLENLTEQELYDYNDGFFKQFYSQDYMTEKDGSYLIDYAHVYGSNNNNLAGLGAQQYISEVGTNMNLFDNVLSWFEDFFGIKNEPEMVINEVLIMEKINELSPKELYEFYRYFNTIKDDGSDVYSAINSILNFETPLKKVNEYIEGIQIEKDINDFINTTTNVVGTGSVPLATTYKLLESLQLKNTNDEFAVKVKKRRKI